jgi:hypothetical protein
MNVLRSIRSVRLSQDRHDSGSSKDYFVSSEAGTIGHVRLIYREPHEGAWPVMKVPVGAVLEVPPLEAHEGPLSRIHQDENGGVTCVLPSYARSQTKMLPRMSSLPLMHVRTLTRGVSAGVLLIRQVAARGAAAPGLAAFDTRRLARLRLGCCCTEAPGATAAAAAATCGVQPFEALPEAEAAALSREPVGHRAVAAVRDGRDRERAAAERARRRLGALCRTLPATCTDVDIWHT